MDATDLGNEIRSRGYWRVNVRPTVFIPERVALRELEAITRDSIVQLRGWDYPHFPREGVTRGNDFIEGATEAAFISHLEVWRLYQSGQFIHLFSMREDWVEGTPLPGLGNVKPGELLSWESPLYPTKKTFLSPRGWRSAWPWAPRLWWSTPSTAWPAANWRHSIRSAIPFSSSGTAQPTRLRLRGPSRKRRKGFRHARQKSRLSKHTSFMSVSDSTRPRSPFKRTSEGFLNAGCNPATRFVTPCRRDPLAAAVGKRFNGSKHRGSRPGAGFGKLKRSNLGGVAQLVRAAES